MLLCARMRHRGILIDGKPFTNYCKISSRSIVTLPFWKGRKQGAVIKKIRLFTPLCRNKLWHAIVREEPERNRYLCRNCRWRLIKERIKRLDLLRIRPGQSSLRVHSPCSSSLKKAVRGIAHQDRNSMQESAQNRDKNTKVIRQRIKYTQYFQNLTLASLFFRPSHGGERC